MAKGQEEGITVLELYTHMSNAWGGFAVGDTINISVGRQCGKSHIIKGIQNGVITIDELESYDTEPTIENIKYVFAVLERVPGRRIRNFSGNYKRTLLHMAERKWIHLDSLHDKNEKNWKSIRCNCSMSFFGKRYWESLKDFDSL
jgi:hypothetical protein